MTPNAQMLYKKLSVLPIREFFTAPMADRIFTNPAELLVDSSRERFIRLLASPGDMPFDKMSDFERFSAFVTGLSQMWGSADRELFFEEFSLLFGYESDMTNPDAAEMWRAFSQKMSEERYDLDGILRMSGAELLTGEVLPIISKDCDYETVMRRNLEAIDCAERRCLSLDVSGLSFEITDRYHAEEAYKSFLGGDESSIHTVLSGLMYSIFEKAKKSKICLFLYIGENYISSKKMIDYFAERGVLPNAVVFASGETERLAAAELCGAYERGKQSVRIEYGLTYNCGDTAEYIADRICALARVYPVGQLTVGGTVTNSPAFAARHRILRKGICMAMLRICSDSDTALECARRIIENGARYV